MIEAPLNLYRSAVAAEWLDYNGHMTESAYLVIVGNSADAFFRFIGIDEAYRAAGRSLYTAETHLRHLREVKVGQQLVLTLAVLGHDAKRLHVLHEMRVDGIGRVATAEQLLLHVNTALGRVAPFGTQIADRLRQIAAAHAPLGTPDYAGRCLPIPER